MVSATSTLGWGSGAVGAARETATPAMGNPAPPGEDAWAGTLGRTPSTGPAPRPVTGEEQLLLVSSPSQLPLPQ